MAEPLYLTFRAPQRARDVRPRPTSLPSSAVPEYPTSWYFDFEKGDFVLSGGMVVETDGDLALVQWCIKTILTERYAYPIYDRRYGTTLDTLIGADSRAEVEASVKRDIYEALAKSDNRVRDVSEFTFDWNSDSCNIGCTVYSARGGSFPLRVGLGVLSPVGIQVSAA